MAHIDYSILKGKTCIFTGRKPQQLGEENPYKPLQLDKKPQFIISVYSSSLIAYNYILPF